MEAEEGRPGGGRKRRVKPAKPYPEFPLYAHAGGVWAKRIRGREHYFGPWGDPDGALKSYLEQRDYLYAGQAPPPEVDGVTLDELVNRYLAAQRERAEMGEITQRHYLDCQRDGKRLLDALGRHRPVATLQPADFATLRKALAAGRGPWTLQPIIVRVRSIFRWGYTRRLLERPMEFGGELSGPRAAALRHARHARGPRDFAAEEVHRLLDATEGSGLLTNLRAMILLGINAGLGNTDCAELRLGHLDLTRRILAFPRPKTGILRRAVLWPETAAALRAALKRRKKMKDIPRGLADRVFVTKARRAYVHMSTKGKPVDSVGLAFNKLVRATGLGKGRGFYGLRHTFRTVADETRDWPAIDLIMGHAASDAAPFAAEMAARYRERISDERLAAVAEHVRGWLVGGGQPSGPAKHKGPTHCAGP